MRPTRRGFTQSLSGARRTPAAHPAGSVWRLFLVVPLLTALAACAPDAPEGGIPTHPSDRFSVTLAWDPPATDAMGDALEDLAGYRLYHSRSTPPNGAEGTQVEVGAATQYKVENLEAGTYYIAVTAIDEAGNESALSNELRVEVGAR